MTDGGNMARERRERERERERPAAAAEAINCILARNKNKCRGLYKGSITLSVFPIPPIICFDERFC
jgi:hypothetical protein